MDVSDEQYGFQPSEQGEIGNDNLTDINLDEIFFNENQIGNGYLDDHGNVNLGFATADQQQQYPGVQAQVNQPGVMFCQGQRMLSDGFGQFTGQPIDIPRSLRLQQQPLPLTPPYSDGPDSPMEEKVLGGSTSSFGAVDHQQLTIDQQQLARLSGRLDNGQILGYDPVSAPHFFTHPNKCETEPRRKRRRTVDMDDIIANRAALGMASIKTEPGILDDLCHDSDSTDSLSNESSSADMDTSYQCLKWKSHKLPQWHALYDEEYNPLPAVDFKVDADKGFNFSFADDAFVCQKKNHFQITSNLRTNGIPKYVKVKDEFKSIERIKLHLFGIKVESPGSTIKVEQSQADRSKKPYDAAVIPLSIKEETRLTVGRLHFSETTSNNMRKKGKPNPDQRYFNLVVAIHAHGKHDSYLVCASSSERIIVRASNPGQFENDVEVVWSRGLTADSVFRMGRVGINTDRPDESFSVHGNMKLTGHMVHPSDMRVKENIREIDSSEQLRNVAKMKLYKYSYSQDYLDVAGLSTEQPDTGVLAQEVQEVLPDAVRESADVVLSGGKTIKKFLVVNKERIFMENVGAVKELCKLTDKLEVRIDELEDVNKKLQTRRRADTNNSCFSSISKGSSLSRTASMCSKISATSSPPPPTGDKKSNPYRCGHHRHYHRHNCHQRQPPDIGMPVEQSWCTPRFMQFLVIVLVLVMFLSIAAMATIYILQDKNFSGSPSNSYKEWGKPVPSRGPYVNTTSSSGAGHQGNNATGSPSPSPSVSTVPDVTQSPSMTNPDASITPTAASRTSGGGEAIITETHTQPSINATTTVTPTPPSHVPHAAETGRSTITTSPPPRRCNCCTSSEKCGVVPAKMVAGKPIYYENNNIAVPQGTPSTPQSYHLRIVEKDYRLACDTCGSINSTFYVPYSAGIPFQPMTIELNSTTSTKVLLCKTSLREKCPEQSSPPPYDTTLAKDNWSTSHRWRLPSAFYFWSSYHFRIVKPGNTPSPSSREADCNSSPGTGGNAFRDYYFHFIRMCNT